MEEAFFFSILRVSAAQIIKAAGFDKCRPAVLNVVTDLYVMHMHMILESAKKFSLARTGSTTNISGEDLLEAMADVGVLKLLLQNPDQALFDSSNTKSLQAFTEWLQFSDQFGASKKLSAVPTSLLTNLIEKRTIDTSVETDQERKKRRLREKQEFYNQLKQGEAQSNQNEVNDAMDALDEDELTNNEKISWLAYIAEKDMKLGQSMKFVNTSIQDYLISVHQNKNFYPSTRDGESSDQMFRESIHNSNKNDYMVLQIQELHEDHPEGEHAVVPSAKLRNNLPYNIAYNDRLLDDDLEQFVAYAESHADEIKTRFEELSRREADLKEQEQEKQQGEEEHKADNAGTTKESKQNSEIAPENASETLLEGSEDRVAESVTHKDKSRGTEDDKVSDAAEDSASLKLEKASSDNMVVDEAAGSEFTKEEHENASAKESDSVTTEPAPALNPLESQPLNSLQTGDETAIDDIAIDTQLDAADKLLPQVAESGDAVSGLRDDDSEGTDSVNEKIVTAVLAVTETLDEGDGLDVAKADPEVSIRDMNEDVEEEKEDGDSEESESESEADDENDADYR